MGKINVEQLARGRAKFMLQYFEDLEEDRKEMEDLKEDIGILQTEIIILKDARKVQIKLNAKFENGLTKPSKKVVSEKGNVWVNLINTFLDRK